MHLLLKRFNHIIRKGLVLLGLVVPFTINAQVKLEPIISKGNIKDLIAAVIDFIFYVSLPVGGIMFIIAGYLFITAAGNPEKITATKKMIFYTFVGLLIIAFAKGLIEFLQVILGV